MDITETTKTAICSRGQVNGFYEVNKPSEDRLISDCLILVQPCTRRRLSELTGLEIPTLCRALFNLVNKTEQVKITHYA
jgi:hypothetical protein